MPKYFAAISPTPFRARVTPRVLALLRREAARDAARECCGLLLGSMTPTSTHVRIALPGTNVSPEPGRRFALLPDDVLAGQRRAEVAGLDVVGFYHSHPRGAAEPSAADGERAAPGYLHLIVAGDVVRAWRRVDPEGPLLEVSL